MAEKNGRVEKAEEQVPVEAIVIAHELLEQGTRLVIVAPEMESIPKKIKLIW